MKKPKFMKLSVALAIAITFAIQPTKSFGQTCPCTIWPTSATPATASYPDTGSVEVGVKFQSDVDGSITGIRFYKGAGNTGTHIGNLWTTTGALLGTATFTNETASGWQQVLFSTPVPITANTTYVASYFAPAGQYAIDSNYFSSQGVTNAPLRALSDSAAGGNGVYRYNNTSTFPNQTFSASNYWVDVIFTQAASGGDTTPPTVTSTVPASGATNVAASTVVTVTFSEAMDASTITTSTILLRNQAGNVVTATVSYNAGAHSATLTPSAALANSATYTAMVLGGTTDPRVKDTAGNAMAADYVWSFSTAPAGGQQTIWPSTATPSVQAASDTSSIELGLKFRSDINGYVLGARFYKGTGNGGNHVANLWTGTGTLLATATFTNETTSGWQQVLFGNPVAIAANTTYVVSYFAPVGRYSFDNNYFAGQGVNNPPLHALANGVDGPNGLYLYTPTSSFPNQSYLATNYWVDLVFTDNIGPDTSPPTVTQVTPPGGASGISASSALTARFSEPLDPATVNASTFELRGPSGSVVSATVGYNSTTFTATLTPASPMSFSTTYTATLHGGSTDPRIKDAAGNALAADYVWSFATSAPPPPPPDQGPGGPILVISSSSNPFSSYYAEILRAEGLNAFSVVDISQVSSSVLANYDVAILGEMPLAASQVTLLSDWVNAGGNLIAMRPDKQLATQLGLVDVGGSIPDSYLLVNTSTGPGVGIVNQTIQYHGSADRYNVFDATVVGTLYSDPSTVTIYPAVTLRTVTSGGHAAAFTYDLARSVVYTRQGNPAWAGEERDGYDPIRSDDLFWGGSAPDWIDLDKVAIPQADEQQRLLANLILQMNLDRKPLPRFWYLPNGKKAAVVMTGDDHANGGTVGRFDHYLSQSPAGCAVDNWECVRSTSYIYPGTPITNSQAISYNNAGFEISLHALTGCANWTPSSLENAYSSQLAQLATQLPGIPAPRTHRIHCLVWSDYSTQPQVELSHGMRLDVNYYYWPPDWAASRPGFFTGSGIPMRFATANGTMIDVYQATTQMTDESGQAYPSTINALLDKAVGTQGYYGVFTANMHTDNVASTGSDAIVASAQARGIPIVSALQMLRWLDGRNASSFGSISWSGNILNFTVAVGQNSNGLQVMLPSASTAGTLNAVTRDGSTVTYTLQTIKGISYAFLSGTPGNYQATYGSGSGNPVPVISNLSPNSATAGGPGFTLTVNGSNFVSGSVVRWNNTSRSTTFVSGGQLTASIPASDIAASGTASVTVSNPAPGGGVSNSLTFTISAPSNPAPTITSLNPSSATAGAPGFTLIVNGTNFIATSVIQWNASNRTTTFVSSTQLQATISSGDIATAGTVPVTVVNPAPGGGTSNSVTFTIDQSTNPVPTITSLNPSSATAGGAAFTLTVNGTNFIGSSVIQWNGSNRATTVISSTQLQTAISSADIATAGTVPVTVVNPAPGGGTSNSVNFTITASNPVPTITSLNPNSATAGGAGFTLTVNGTNFIASSVIQWNGSNRTTTFLSSTQLQTAISSADIGTAGTVPVTVLNPAPGGGTSNSVNFTIIASNPVPTITNLNPSSATAGGAAFTLTVNGTNFIGSSVIQWNGSNRATTFVSSTQLQAAISSADIANAGTVPVTVVNPAPGGGTSNSQTFTINSAGNPIPTITTLNPSSALARGAAFTLTVNGTNFVNGSIVRWNGSNRTTSFVSSAQLTAAISASDIATSGTRAVTVFNPAPGGGTSASVTFTVNDPPAPTISALSPSSTMAGGASFTLTVNGNNFVTNSVVRWNGSNRTTTFVSSTQLTAVVTAADISNGGTRPITVFTPTPGGGTSNSLTFTINNPTPSISSLIPSSLPRNSPSFTLTINGAGFTPSSVVRWDGSSRSTTFISSTQILAFIPKQDLRVVGTHTITVFNPTPGGGTSNSQPFTVN